MNIPLTEIPQRTRQNFHPQAYSFLSEALKTAQDILGNPVEVAHADETHHISGPELLEGVRVLGLRRYGPMASVVFGYWGLHSTDDFGRMVFEMIDRGEMRKSERDQLSDFHAVYTCFPKTILLMLPRPFAKRRRGGRPPRHLVPAESKKPKKVNKTAGDPFRAQLRSV